MKKVFLRLTIFSILFLCAFNLFAEIKVISPVEGIWANKQALVIETTGKGDYFYSLNDTDPSAFGFAYDGPVLIDLKDDVTVRIVYIENGMTKDSKTINYQVSQNPALNKKYSEFISSFYDSGILNYTAGAKLEIPSDLVYTLGKSLRANSFLEPRTLKLSDECILSNYIPCIVKDENTQFQWRFLIRTLPLFAGIYSRRDVPFYITDWDTITFTNEDYIYKIDSEYWGLPKTSKKLDRSISHMISWQSINYEAGNPIEFFVLPEKPELKIREEEDGSKVFYIEGDSSYAMGLKSTSSDYQELFSEFSVDAFYGDSVSGMLDLEIFSNSVYQGSLKSPYIVDKYPPAKPVVQADTNTFYSRKPVTVKITSEKESSLYYAISEPYVIEDVSLSYTQDSRIFQNIKPVRYIKSEKNSVSMNLRTQNEGAVFFKISAYAQKGDFKSAVSEYTVIIDQFNFYYDKNSTAEVQNGTANAPFTNFEDCIKAVNERRRSCIHLNSDVDVPSKQLTLLSNCILQPNKEEVTINFESGSSLVVKSSSLEINNCNLKMNGFNSTKNKTVIPVIKLENSVLDLIDCHGTIEFGKTGTFVDSSSSTINIDNCVLYVSAQNYVSEISAIKSRLNIKNSIMNANADTAVILSLNEGDINLKNNSFKVSGSMGRVAEFFNVGGIADSNKFQTDLSRGENQVYPIFADKKSTFRDVNNVGNGF